MVPTRAQQRRQTLAVTAALVLLTAVMTWPQVLHLSTRAREHHDVYFNMWRLGWIAHALASEPTRLFEGNIFHPERRTLTLSDAMIVEGAIAAPLYWAGLSPVLIHNLMLLGAIVSSGAGIFVLARHLAGSAAAGLAAAIIFAFAPYRFDHYMHMELQWTMWMPWTFWAMHRTLETGSRRYGALTGLFLSLQMLSSIYYGVFLATALAVAGTLLIVGSGVRLMRAVRAFAPGVLIAAVICGAYARPYLTTNKEMGGRSEHEILMFSARPSSYLVATPDNVMWGHAFSGRSRPERRLFPGALAVLLGLIGLLLRAPSVVALVYFVAAVGAFEMSLGFSGYSYRFLYDHVPLFHGLRAIARAGIFVVFFLAVLAAFGFRALADQSSPTVRRVLAIAVCVVLLLEYRVRPLGLVRYPSTPPPLQAWLAEQPPGVVAELPMGPPDARYSYLSSFHWKPTVNGYSGFHPRSYLDRSEAMQTFPDEQSIVRLRRDGVRYLVVHTEQYTIEERETIAETLTKRHGFVELARFPGDREEAVVWGLR